MKVFLEACGLSGSLILGLQAPDQSSVSWIVFDRPFVVVGRDPSADLILQGTEVSRRHAYLQVVAGRLFCVDLESRTGTCWGDEPGSWGWVDPAFGIRIGGYRVYYRGGASDDTAINLQATMEMPVSRAFVQPGLPEMTLEILGRSAGASSWRSSRALVLVGGSPACKIRLIEGEVAAIHAAILRTPGGIFAIDLLARRGLRVNDRPIRSTRLRDGDELTVGNHALLVRCESPPVLPAVIRPETADAMSDLITRELGEIRRQSADHLREMLEGVVRVLAEVHQDQMAAVREDLAQLRALIEEQGRDASRTANHQPVSQPPPWGSTSDPSPVISGVDHRHLRLVNARDDPDDVRGPASSGTSKPAASVPTVSSPSHDNSPDRIFERLAAIQAEGQGRWDRLIAKVLGQKL